MMTPFPFKRLDVREMAAFKFIYEHARDHGFQPTLKQISHHLGYQGPMSCGFVFRSLEAKGWIGRVGACKRSALILRRPDGSPFKGFRDKP